MRLLRRKRDGSIELTPVFTGNVSIPQYAILSHTWLSGSQEVTFEDITNNTGSHKTLSYAKIRFCGEQAAKDDLEYFWVDTCCINRQNHAELQEAITSMFRWYQRAAKCYVYMSDVSVTRTQFSQSEDMWWEPAFRGSRWFRRGWTLQELLAPRSVEFFSKQCVRLGDKRSLEQCISETTGIPLSALHGEPLSSFPVEERLGWAQRRETTRKEDKAYSLLGIFGVFMPLIYGEEDNAFVRLREYISKSSPETREYVGQSNPDNAALDSLLGTLPTSPSAAFDSADNQYLSTCLDKTRVELIEAIDAWFESSDGCCIFWLNGIAGTGKSTISQTVCKRYQSGGGLGASFFFSKGGGDASQASKLIPTLATQLAHRIPNLRAHICEAIKSDSGIAQKGIREQWSQLIIEPLSRVQDPARPPGILLVLDALDECENSRDIELILELWSETEKLNELSLKIFITSRPEIPIRCGLQEIPEPRRKRFVLHDVKQETIDRDLRVFFQHHLTLLRRERGFESAWPSAGTISRLVELSDGLFVWASTACLYIRNGGAAAKDRTAKLANGDTYRTQHEHLDKLYLSVLEEAVHDVRYDEDELAGIHQSLKEILGTIILLNSRLSLHALAKLLNMELERVKDTLADLHTILIIPDDDHGTLRLHHPTFRDFLLDRNRCNNEDFWIDEHGAQHALAKNCIRLMTGLLGRDLCGLRAPGNSSPGPGHARVEKCIPLELQYACLEWAEHIRRGQIRFRQQRELRDNDEIHGFLKKHFLHWVEALSLLGKSSRMAAVMRTYLSLLKPGENSEQVPFCKHARMYVGEFHSQAENAPLQLYCAGLIFMPHWNLLRRHFQDELHPYFAFARVIKVDGPEQREQYNYVNDIAFSPDGRKLASGSLDEWARVWDYSRLSEEAKYAGHWDKVSSVDISSDGKLLASGSDDSTIRVFNMDSTDTLFTLTAHNKWIDSVTFSPDNKVLASGSMDETVRLWDMSTGEELEVIEPELGGINSVSFSPDGTLLAVGMADPVIHLYDTEKYKLTKKLHGHEGPVNSAQFSPDGLLLASGSDDYTVRLWDLEIWEEKLVLRGHEDRVWATSFSQVTPAVVASGSEDRTIKVWNPTDGCLLVTLKGHTSGICAVAFAPDDRTLAAAAFNDEVRFWYAKKEQAGDIQPAGKLPDFSEDRLDSHSGEAVEALENQHGHQSAVTCLVLSNDGTRVATGSEHDTIKLWTTDGKEESVLQVHSDGINHLVFSSDGQLLVSGSMDSTVGVWQADSGKLLHRLEGHTGAVRVVRFATDEGLLASCSNDRTVRLWDLTTGAPRNTLHGHGSTVNDIAFSPDDKLIASCSADGMVCLWSTQSATQLLDPINAHESSVNSIEFSSDGHLIVSASTDTTVKVFDVDGRACNSFRGHTLPVNCASFSQDMKYVASGSVDGTIRIWNRDTGNEEHKLDVGVEIRRVSISVCGRYVETDRGFLDISRAINFSHLDSPEVVRIAASGGVEDSSHIFVAEQWVQHNADNVLWLPEHFRVRSVATRKRSVILGHVSGALTFFRLKADVLSTGNDLAFN